MFYNNFKWSIIYKNIESSTQKRIYLPLDKANAISPLCFKSHLKTYLMAASLNKECGHTYFKNFRLLCRTTFSPKQICATENTYKFDMFTSSASLKLSD